jgi:two-component system alkaline phosphatase synthesis response regulator PhoP
MARVLIVASDNETRSELRQSLSRYNLICSCSAYNNGVREAVTGAKPDVLLLEVNEEQPIAELMELIGRMKKRKSLPVIALIPAELLERIDLNLDADDFVTSPCNAKELFIRISRLLRKNGNQAGREQIKCDGLTIDSVTCEVTVNGSIVDLTFKEYELLKLMASHPGRVYTRQTLLDSIWGYDYFGGDRTVDVHVRRLRSKIEDANHTYIETVRNIGYRFIKQS